MRKTVSPAVAIVVIVVVVLIVVVAFVKQAKTKRVQMIPGRGIVQPGTGRIIGPGERRGQRRGGRGVETGPQRGPAGRR